MNRDHYVGRLVKVISSEKDALENLALKKYGITPFQMHILMYLFDSEEQDCTRSLKELEHALVVSQSTMAKVIKVMVENKQLLEYIDDPYDRRVKKVTLTPKAIELCKCTDGIVNELEERLTVSLTAKETERLKKLLTKVTDSLQMNSR